MKRVHVQFTLNPQQNKQAASQAQSQAKYIDSGEKLVSEQVAPRDL